MSLLDLFFDWLIWLLPEKAQWASIGLLGFGVALIFGLGWYFAHY